MDDRRAAREERAVGCAGDRDRVVAQRAGDVLGKVADEQDRPPPEPSGRGEALRVEAPRDMDGRRAERERDRGRPGVEERGQLRPARPEELADGTAVLVAGPTIPVRGADA